MLNKTENSNEEHQMTFIISTILTGVLAVFMWCIGLFLHSKIIAVSIKDKELTWKFDVVNSFTTIFHYGNAILMYGMTYIIKDIYRYTGTWVCYISKALAMYGNTQVLHQTSIICAMKYIIIVKHDWVRNFGQEK